MLYVHASSNWTSRRHRDVKYGSRWPRGDVMNASWPAEMEQAQDGKQQYALPQGAPNMANPYMLHERRGTKGGKGGKGVAASSKGASELRCRGCNIILRLGHLHQPTCPLGRGEPVQENESMGWNAQVISDTPGAAPGGEGSHGFWHSVELEDFEGRLKEAGLSINDVEVIKDNSGELVDLLHELDYKDAVQRLKVLRALRAHFGDSSATGAG